RLSPNTSMVGCPSCATAMPDNPVRVVHSSSALSIYLIKKENLDLASMSQYACPLVDDGNLIGSAPLVNRLVPRTGAKVGSCTGTALAGSCVSEYITRATGLIHDQH